MEQWHTYFSVTAGASATLTGLIFVGVSINLTKILMFRQLPSRALGTLILLTNNLLVSSFCLLPDQSLSALGWKILFFAIFIWLFNSRMDILGMRDKENKYRPQIIQNLIFNQMAILTFISGSLFLLNNHPSGFSWLVAGISLSFVKAILDAWVLLIEIQR